MLHDKASTSIIDRPALAKVWFGKGGRLTPPPPSTEGGGRGVRLTTTSLDRGGRGGGGTTTINFVRTATCVNFQVMQRPSHLNIRAFVNRLISTLQIEEGVFITRSQQVYMVGFMLLPIGQPQCLLTKLLRLETFEAMNLGM